MRISSCLAVAAAAAAALPALAQSVSLTHNERTDVVDFLSGLGCTLHGASSSDHSWWRAFDLAELGITGDFVVTSVEFGVSFAAAPTLGGVQPVQVQLYQAPAGSRPATGFPARGGGEALVADTVGPGTVPSPLVEVELSGRIDAGSTLIVPITPLDHTARAPAGGDMFYAGVNSFGETDPSYFMAPSCGTPQPATWSELGASAHQSVVMIVHGFVDGGCYADCDGSGSLDFFDFLCFMGAFESRDPYADCDESGAPDFFDFKCFQGEFAAGCP